MKTTVVEPDVIRVPITTETAHQFFNKRQMEFIKRLAKANYREGFLNGMKMKTAIFLLFTSICFSQTAFVSAGKENFTIGETFPLMQQCDTVINEVSLSVPKYTIETPKPIVIKKLTFWQKLLKIFGL